MWLQFFLVFLILSNLIVSYVTNNSIYADEIILYETLQRSGSDEISTDNLCKERCWVNVQIIIKSSHHGIYHRNNPDKTFYPADAFDYEINMDDDNVLDIKRDPVNLRVLLYQYDDNFGTIESLKINDVTITLDNLPECFKIKSPNTCVISVPQEHQLDQLNITATNIWNGKASATLPEIDENILNSQPPDPQHLIFDGMLGSWIVLVLVFLLMILAVFWIIRKYQEQT